MTQCAKFIATENQRINKNTMKGFIEATDTMLSTLLINVNEIQILYCDSAIKIKGVDEEIELEETYDEIKELIKSALE